MEANKTNMDPFQFMVANRKTITEVLAKTAALSKAWDEILQELPEISELIKFNTFKAYARFLNAFNQELEEKETLEKKNRELKIELDRIRFGVQNHDYQTESVPNRIDGWGIQLKGRYYRLFKKINGKVKWIHLGRKWNQALARQKIKSFMSNL